MPKPRKHHELFRALLDRDARFKKFVNSGKGSHYIIAHPDIGGHKASLPIPCHGGKDVHPRILAQVIRRFGLPKDFFG